MIVVLSSSHQCLNFRNILLSFVACGLEGYNLHLMLIYILQLKNSTSENNYGEVISERAHMD